MVSIQTSRPMELVCMDFLSLEPDSHNTKDILVITDHFTKYAVAIPTKDQKAITVAHCLWEQFFIHYGFPERLHSDQGRDFESQIVKELCALVGTKKVRTSPYHPRGNPVERYNRTLLSMLGTLREREKTRWREYVKPLTHAYNCTKNEVTGYSPYELMFGRQPRLPIDIAFGLPVKGASSTSHSQYVKNLKSYLKESYNIAMKNAKKVADKNKKRFDMRVRESCLEIGDRVLVRNLRLRNKHKLADRWEPTVYVVQKRAGELPVYTVCPAGQDEPTRTLHRDLLLPCGFLAEEDAEPEQPVRVSRPRTRQSTLQPAENPVESDEEDYSLSYPLRFEVETRIIGPEVMYPTEKTPDVAQPGNEPSPQTHSSTVPENLPDITPEVQCSDIPSSSTTEEEPDLIQFPPDDPIDAEPVEKELPSNQSNMNAEPESS
uniref:Integrase catalytic domain-containing protein n=1 Tax=Pygocentrus nattereri TaxID=42514 RepID=A0AAR2LHM1_PYGNA